MTRKPYVGKVMYAIFSSQQGTYVQPCKVLELTDDGFYANCHNGGDGREFFSNDTIGIGVFFSKDSAQVRIIQ